LIEAASGMASLPALLENVIESMRAGSSGRRRAPPRQPQRGGGPRNAAVPAESVTRRDHSLDESAIGKMCGRLGVTDARSLIR
jgi:hypothetical protein